MECPQKRETPTGSSPAGMFDRFAPEYDEGFHTNRVGTFMRQVWGSILETHARPGDRLLDVGCGTGEDAIRLAGHGCQVHCVDISPNMISIAREKAAHAGVGPAVTFECSSFEDPSLASKSLFDGVYSGFGSLNFTADLANVLANLRQKVREHGWLIAMVSNTASHWDILTRLLTGKPGWAFDRIRGVPTEITSQHGSSGIRFFSRRFFLDTADEAGFSVLFSRPLGCLIPPAYLAETPLGSSIWLRMADRIERITHKLPVLRSSGDFLVVGLGRHTPEP